MIVCGGERDGEGEVCRGSLGRATLYKLQARYGGMEVSDAQWLKMLEDENGALKRMLADAMPDDIVPQDLQGKV